MYLPGILIPFGILGGVIIILLTLLFAFAENKDMDKPKITAKDFFLHVAILATLYTSVISVITLLVQTINAAFPDVLEGYYYSYQGYTSGMRFAVASLIIVFPVFVFLSWWNHRRIARTPELGEISIRKWFNYLTLFLAGVTITGDLIAFLNSFLGGELSVRFMLKVLAVLVISLLVFVYHLYELRGQAGKPAVYRTFRALSILAILASIVWSFVVIGSPATVRAYRFDEQRVSNLNDIQYQVINYWQQKRKLPASLTDLNDSISGYVVPTDPETKAAYDYRVLGVLKFELCANFTLASRTGNGSIPKNPYMLEGDNWQHSTGQYCFERTIDPERYPPVDTKVPSTIPVR